MNELEFVKRLRRDDRGSWPKMKHNSVLVPGETYTEPEWKQVQVRILKKFHLAGNRIAQPGDVVTLPEPEARDAIELKRAEPV